MSVGVDTCAQCHADIAARCPRCDRGLCDDHGIAPEDGCCALCERDIQERMGERLGARVAIDVGAAVGGMVGGGVVGMLAAAALGLGGGLILMSLLVTQLAGGGVAAYAADRRVQRWLRHRAETDSRRLPAARLLPERAD